MTTYRLTSWLQTVAQRLPPELYMVIDGARLPDLGLRLAQGGLQGRALFLEGKLQRADVSGPWLVKLPDMRLTEAVSVLPQDLRPMVWSWSHGEMALYRHLRTLNAADVPVEPPDADDVIDTEPDSGEAREVVLFRHWDPEVMSLFWPLLTPSQTARFLGPSNAICFVGPGSEGERVLSGTGAGLPTSDPLAFSQAQMDALSAARLERSRRQIMLYLRDTAPEETQHLSDDALHAHVLKAEQHGDRLDLKSQHAHGLWAFLMLLTNNAVAHDPNVAEYLRTANKDPDDAIRDLMDAVADAADEG
jgi:hypothetical protein